MNHLNIGETVIPRPGTRWNGRNVGGIALIVERVDDDGVTEPVVELSSIHLREPVRAYLADVLASVWDREDVATVELLGNVVFLVGGTFVLVVAAQLAIASVVGAWIVGAGATAAVGSYLYRKWSKR